MKYNPDHEDFLFPVTPKEEIDKCLNCTRPDCDGYCTRSRTVRKIRCVETGEVFETQADAAASVNRGRATMSQHLSGVLKTCGGRHFELIGGEE